MGAREASQAGTYGIQNAVPYRVGDQIPEEDTDTRGDVILKD